MNIFMTSADPLLCARVLDDRRLVKMVLETAQMLSTCVRTVVPDIDPEDDALIYRKTHANHPCCVWARESQSNFVWLAAHGVALATMFRLRFDKRHKSLDVIKACVNYAQRMPAGILTALPNCTDFKDEPNIFHAYRKHLSRKWYNDRFDKHGKLIHKNPHPRWSRDMAPPFMMDEWPIGVDGIVKPDRSMTKPFIDTQESSVAELPK